MSFRFFMWFWAFMWTNDCKDHVTLQTFQSCVCVRVCVCVSGTSSVIIIWMTKVQHSAECRCRWFSSSSFRWKFSVHTCADIRHDQFSITFVCSLLSPSVTALQRTGASASDDSSPVSAVLGGSVAQVRSISWPRRSTGTACAGASVRRNEHMVVAVRENDTSDCTLSGWKRCKVVIFWSLWGFKIRKHVNLRWRW